jgi:hypothetical protein
VYNPNFGDIRFRTGNNLGDVLTIKEAGNVGIGTSSPDAKLVIANPATGVPTLKLSGFADGTAGIPYAIINFFNEDGSQAGPNNAAAIKALNASTDGSGGQLGFYTSPPNAAEGADAVERMRLDAPGNLGLGVTPSAWATLKGLQVLNANMAGLGNKAYFSANAFFNGSSWVYQASDFANLYIQQDGQHQWNTAPSGTAGDAISFTQAMSLTAAGNLVLGATDSDFRLSSLVQSGADRDVFQAAIIGASNGFRIKWNHATSTTRINISNLPTSSAGLAAGDLYNDSGTLKVA